MISPGDLLEYKIYFMNERHLEKDYLQRLLLYEIYLNFSSDLIFKGGTALKMFYGLNRFSEDLDFTYVKEEERKQTISKFDSVLNRFDKMYKISKLKRRGTSTSLDYELGIEGPLFSRTSIQQNIEVNVSMREKLILEPELRSIGSMYQDILLFTVYVLRIDEILAEKVRALLTRKRVKARDVYDIYYLIRFRGVKPNDMLIDRKLKLYSKKFSKREMMEKIMDIGKSAWKSELSNIIKDVPNYDNITVYLDNNW